MTCGTCTHWRLTGPLAQHGYGQCLARPEQLRQAITTTAGNVCRMGKFVAVVVPQGALL
jgi:hypothetical protein